jgi:hypothetical protein
LRVSNTFSSIDHPTADQSLSSSPWAGPFWSSLEHIRIGTVRISTVCAVVAQRVRRGGITRVDNWRRISGRVRRRIAQRGGSQKLGIGLWCGGWGGANQHGEASEEDECLFEGEKCQELLALFVTFFHTNKFCSYEKFGHFGGDFGCLHT